VKAEDGILGLLYDRGEAWVSLGELASRCGATVAAAESALAALERRGHAFERSPAQGVRLVRPVRLDACLIERGLNVRRVGRHVLCFDEVDSTNDVAADAARQADADGLAVLAESQRRGRGRLGRQWVSPGGANVLMSVLLIDQPQRLAHDALTIAAGLAAAEAIADACGVDCRLKWPNDVLVDEAKAAGVLVEMRRVAGRRCMVVGLGVNANAAPPAGSVDRRAVSLAERLGHAVERVELVRALLRRLDERAGQVAGGELETLRQDWLSRCGMLNRRLAVRCAGKRYVGRALDVDPLGGLVLCEDSDRRVHLPAEHSTIEEMEGDKSGW